LGVAQPANIATQARLLSNTALHSTHCRSCCLFEVGNWVGAKSGSKSRTFFNTTAKPLSDSQKINCCKSR